MTTIKPDKRFGIIFAGSREELRTAVADNLGPRPFAHSWVNGYGSIHCDVWTTTDALRAWMRQDNRLRFFLGKT